MSKALRTKRAIQEIILRTLNVQFESNPEVCVLAGHIYRGLANSMVPPDRAEIREALADLVERKLVTSKASPIDGEDERCFGVTADGRDFVDHGFPWHEIDRFSGRSQ